MPEPTDSTFFNGWYQTVPLGDGRVVQGEQDCTPRFEAMTRLHGDLSGKTVLDVGAAEGFFSAECAQRGAQVSLAEANGTMVDRSHYVLSERKLTSRCQWYLEDCVDVLRTFTDEDFDAALSLNVIHHLPGPLQHLYDLARVLKPGGVLYLEVPHELGHGIRLRKKHDYVLGYELVREVLNRAFSRAVVVHDWRNSVGNRRVLWEAIK